MDLGYKFKRILRWRRRIGLMNALAFEWQKTLRRSMITIYHPGLQRHIHLRGGSSDLSVFEHVFIDNEFDLPLDAPKLIIDGGANCGFAALYLACRYPDAQIIAVEPDGDNCKMCRLNTAGLNVELRQTALWSSSTWLRIENPVASSWSFRCVEADAGAEDAFEACDIATLLDGRNCDLLKLDIEGAELELFKDPDWLQHVSAIVVEIHSKEAETMIRTVCDGWALSRTGEKLLVRKPSTAADARPRASE